MAESDLQRALALLSSPRWRRRVQGMEILAELNLKEAILDHALKEKILAVVEVAAEALFPEPPELLRHMLTMAKGPDANLVIGFHIPKGNYLYAENVITDIYRPRKSRLASDVVAAIGYSYLQRAGADFLPRYLSASLMTHKTAFERLGPKAVAGVEFFQGWDGSDSWSRTSALAIEAAVALRRLDVAVPLSDIHRMLKELPEAIDAKHQVRLMTEARLEWILFDAGETADAGHLIALVERGATQIVADLATTFLKRKQFDAVVDLAGRFNEAHFAVDGFCYWPLINFLENRGLMDVGPYGDHRAGPLYGYRRARTMNLAPPPWWEWQ